MDEEPGSADVLVGLWLRLEVKRQLESQWQIDHRCFES